MAGTSEAGDARAAGAAPSPDRRPQAMPGGDRHQRTSGAARIVLGRPHPAAGIGGMTGHEGARVVEAYQDGAARVRFPRVFGSPAREVVLVNTAGGLTGGDRFCVSVSARPGAMAAVTSQAAEKVYRASTGVTSVSVALRVCEGAALAWAPQETILFDRSALARTLDLEAEAGARFLVIEPIVFGRLAMGERVSRATLRDRWRVRLGGRLVFAEQVRLAGDVAAGLEGPAAGGGRVAFATGLFLGPDAADARDALRDLAPEDGLSAGVGLVRGLLTFRLAARDPMALRRWIRDAYTRLASWPPPVCWSC